MCCGLNCTSTRRPTRSEFKDSMPGLASACRISAASSAQSIPATCSLSSEFLDCGKHFLGVTVDLHAIPPLDDLAVGADQVGGPRHAHVLLAVHRLFLPDAVLLD